MRLVIQRVTEAQVTVANELVGKIGAGLCVFVGFGRSDGEANAKFLADKLIRLRIFEDDQGIVWFRRRICVPDVRSIRELILREVYDSAYSIHPGSTKMYQDLKDQYWWYGLK